MTFIPKERVKAAFAHQEPDRVPFNYHFFNGAIDRRMKDHFGLASDDDEGLRKALDVDFRRVKAPYVRRPLHAAVPDREVSPEWGIRSRLVEHETGSYWEPCDFPLRDASVDEVERWPMPSPDDYDYSQIPVQCESFKAYYLVAGTRGVGDCINNAGFLCSMERVLIGLALEEPAVMRLIDRRRHVELEVMRRTLEAGHGRIDMLLLGEDLGTQRGPMVGPEFYRRLIKPRHQEFTNLARAYNVPVMFHSDGAVSWAYDDFIQVGIHVHDAVQMECEGMDPARLKKGWGERLSFHGVIPTTGPLAHGSAQDITNQVRDILDIMKPGGGHVLSPSHNVQDNTPVENVLAMYEAGQKYGAY